MIIDTTPEVLKRIGVDQVVIQSEMPYHVYANMIHELDYPTIFTVPIDTEATVAISLLSTGDDRWMLSGNAVLDYNIINTVDTSIPKRDAVMILDYLMRVWEFDLNVPLTEFIKDAATFYDEPNIYFDPYFTDKEIDFILGMKPSAIASRFYFQHEEEVLDRLLQLFARKPLEMPGAKKSKTASPKAASPKRAKAVELSDEVKAWIVDALKRQDDTAVIGAFPSSADDYDAYLQYVLELITRQPPPPDFAQKLFIRFAIIRSRLVPVANYPDEAEKLKEIRQKLQNLGEVEEPSASGPFSGEARTQQYYDMIVRGVDVKKIVDMVTAISDKVLGELERLRVASHKTKTDGVDVDKEWRLRLLDAIKERLPSADREAGNLVLDGIAIYLTSDFELPGGDESEDEDENHEELLAALRSEEIDDVREILGNMIQDEGDSETLEYFAIRVVGAPSIERSRFTPDFLTNLIALINELFGASYMDQGRWEVIENLETLEMTDAYPDTLLAITGHKINDLRDAVEAGIDDRILDEIYDIILANLETFPTAFVVEMIRLFQSLLLTYPEDDDGHQNLEDISADLERQYPGTTLRATQSTEPIPPSRIRKYIDALEQRKFNAFINIEGNYGPWRDAARGVPLETLTPDFIDEFTAFMEANEPDTDTTDQMLEIMYHRIEAQRSKIATESEYYEDLTNLVLHEDDAAIERLLVELDEDDLKSALNALDHILDDRENMSSDFTRNLVKLLTRTSEEDPSTTIVIDHIISGLPAVKIVKAKTKTAKSVKAKKAAKAKTTKTAKKTAKAKAASSPLILSLLEDDEIEPFEEMLLASSATDDDVLGALNDISAELSNVNFSPDFARQILILMVRLSKDHILDDSGISAVADSIVDRIANQYGVTVDDDESEEEESE